MNLEEQLSSVLSDPEAMSKISSIIGALGAGTPPAAPSAPPSEPSAAFNLPDMGGDRRVRLLNALKPFLSEKRAPYVDGAVTILKMMQLGKLGKDLKLF